MVDYLAPWSVELKDAMLVELMVGLMDLPKVELLAASKEMTKDKKLAAVLAVQ